MKKSTKIVLLLASFLFAMASRASQLETELSGLAMPLNKGPVSIAKDKLYSVQSRFAPLSGKHEFAMSGGKNLNQDGYINSNQFGTLYRYHINDSWSVGANFFKMNNALSSSGQKLLNDRGVIPDRDYIKNQIDAMAEYNLFYGKLRFNMEQVTYFDQYIALGAGQVSLGKGSAMAAIVDTGLAFWVGKRMTARMGLKNDFYREQNLNGSTNVHNMVGYVAFGYMFGGQK